MKFSFSHIIIGFLLMNINCSKSQKETIIRGNIPNLPDGILYLYEGNGTNRIDSINTIKGMFELKHFWIKNEPIYIGVDHVDKQGVLRFFSFTTNAKYRGVPNWGTNLFLSDSLITINGNLTEQNFVGVKFPSNQKPVIAPSLIGGKQTKAYFNIDGDLFEKIDNKTILTVKQKLTHYPNSYHLLYKIEENKNSFSPQQVDEFLKSFKGEITQSKTYKKLHDYNQKRFNGKNIILPMLENSKGTKTQIIDKKYKKHLIVFWASWCGPCRQEIPMLKKIYKIYSDDIELISISTDTDLTAWHKSLEVEKMNWKQLVVSKNSSDNESLQIHFKLNQAIPYTVLVDNDLKILASFTGLSNEAELEKILAK